jgi:hypothetical protein
MTNHHLGNNWYVGRWSEGDRREQLPAIQKCVHIDADTGVFSYFTNNAWNTVTNNTKADQIFVSILRQMPMNNIGTVYKDIFPNFYDNFPIPFSTVGYNHFGIVLLWNKNSGTGRHDVRIVDAANPNEVLVDSESLDTGNGGDPTTGGLKSGRTKNYNLALPAHFVNFRGELIFQAKSTVAGDNPIFDGLLIYNIR